MSAEASGQGLRVLMISSEWPSAEHPGSGVFIEQQARFLRSAGVDVDVVAFRGAKDPRRYVRAWIEVQRRGGGAAYHLPAPPFGPHGPPPASLPAPPGRPALCRRLPGSVRPR